MAKEAQINKIALIITAVVVVIVFGYVLSTQFKPKLTIPGVSNQASAPVSNVTAAQLPPEAILSECDKPTFFGNKTSCYLNLSANALSNRKIGTCFTISSPQYIDLCTSGFINLAVERNDVSICSDNDICKVEFAIKTKNSQICETLDEEAADYCKRKASG